MKGTLSVVLLCMLSLCLYGKPPALTNLGNSCYFNAALQGLYSITYLTTFLLQHEQDYKADSIIVDYIHLLQKIKNGSNYLTTLNNFYKKADNQLRQHQQACGAFSQQDSQEFLSWFVNQLSDSLLDAALQKSVDNFFTLPLQTSIFCPETKITTYVEQIQENKLLAVPVRISGQLIGGSLTDVLSHFFTQEWVEYGKPLTQCIKKETIVRLPDTLIVMLKRYDSDPAISLQNYNHSITIPFQMDMQKIQSSLNNGVYDLKAGIIQGGGLTGGHYVAYVKEGNEWYYCNDNTIEKVTSPDPNVTEVNKSAEQVQKKWDIRKGYIFIYERVQKEPINPLNDLNNQLSLLQNALQQLQDSMKNL